MIVVRCRGGLGNQLFQYACGRALAQRRRTRLLLDLSHYRGHELRRFELDHFAVRYRRAALKDLGRFRDLGGRAALASAPWRLFGRGPCTVVRERDFRYDPEAFAAGGHLSLEGFWQSYRYFEDYAGELRAELSPREPLEGPEAALAARVAGGETVAVHVRGGDYRLDPEANRTLGALAPDYYAAALALVRRRVRDPLFLVFSDDPAWAQRALPPGDRVEHVASRPPGRGWVDLWLMSRCRHQVIANSTFSWWAGWLNPDPGKIVVAPRQWFRDGSRDTSDLLPGDWTAV